MADEWPWAKVLAYAAWIEETNPWVSRKRTSPGYIAAEIRSRVERAICDTKQIG